eukprot:scaffold15878_cov67-Attheya_sp.AAC.1
MMKVTSLLALLAVGLQNLPHVHVHAFSAVPCAISRIQQFSTNKCRSSGIRTPEVCSSTRLSADSTSASFVAIPDPAPVFDDHMPPAIPKLSFKWMPVRWLLKTLKVRVLGSVIFAGMFLLNSFFSVLFMVIKPWMRKIQLRRFAGFMMTYSMTPLVELKFDFGRMLSYVPFLFQADDRLFSLRNNMRTADELTGTPEMPTDDVFISQVIQRSPAAFYTTNMQDKLIVDLSSLDDIDNFEDTYIEINRIEVDKKTSAIKIFTKSGASITRKEDGDAKFERAMEQAMSSLSFFIPGIGHSWVHFLFPDAVAAVVHNDVPRKSVLYKLLEPHIRYTSRINWEALGVRGPLVFGGSSLVRFAAEATTAAPRGIPPSTLEKKFESFAPFPISSDEFVRKNSERTTGYYFSDEFACPPKWFEGPSAELPYIKSLKRLYPIVRDHVEKVLQHEEKATIEKFITDVDMTSRIDGKSLDLHRFDPIDVIATLIFDVSFIHSTDHYFTYRVFNESRYGMGQLRHPIARKWYPGSRVPEDSRDDDDRVRYQGFSHVFIRFNDSKLISNSMANLKYKFTQKELKKVNKAFIAEIEAEQDKMTIDGDMFCPLKDVARSVCF